MSTFTTPAGTVVTSAPDASVLSCVRAGRLAARLEGHRFTRLTLPFTRTRLGEPSLGRAIAAVNDGMVRRAAAAGTRPAIFPVRRAAVRMAAGRRA